jgi:hypothetical protein
MSCAARSVLASLAVLAACGRWSFEARDDAGDRDAGDGDAADEISVFDRVALPPGGMVEGLALGTVPGQVYAWFWAGRIFRTDDAGQSWVECPPNTGDHMVVAADGTVYLALNRSEILTSKDGCASWQDTGSGVYAFRLAAAGTRVFAATWDGLRVHDGSQWMVIDSPFEGTQVRALAIHGDTILIGSEQGIARSLDGGAQWTIQNQGLSNLRVVGLAIAASNPQRVWALERSGGTTTGAAFRSDDGGSTWTQVFDNGGDDLAVDPGNPDRVLFANYVTLLETTNGTSFVDVRTPEMGVTATYSVTFDTAGNAYTGAGRGMFYRPGSGAFEPRHGALDVWNLRAGATTPARDTVYWATSAGLLRSTDGGEAFTHETQGFMVTSALGNLIVPPTDPDTLLAAGRFVWRSLDRGRSFTSLWDPGSANNYAVNAIALAGNRLFAATGTQVAYADPPWTAWTGVQLGGGPRSVRDVAALPDGRVVACAAGAVYLSTDNGQSFQPLADAPSGARRSFGTADGTLLLATDDGLWSYAGGAWTARGLTGVVWDVLVEDTTWIASAPDGVFETSDGGATWVAIPGLAGRVPLSLARDAAGNLLVGTAAYGLFRARR